MTEELQSIANKSRSQGSSIANSYLQISDFFPDFFTHRFWPTEEANVDVVGHFRVPKYVVFKTGLSAKPFF